MMAVPKAIVFIAGLPQCRTISVWCLERKGCSSIITIQYHVLSPPRLPSFISSVSNGSLVSILKTRNIGGHPTWTRMLCIGTCSWTLKPPRIGVAVTEYEMGPKSVRDVKSVTLQFAWLSCLDAVHADWRLLFDFQVLHLLSVSAAELDMLLTVIAVIQICFPNSAQAVESNKNWDRVAGIWTAAKSSQFCQTRNAGISM